MYKNIAMLKNKMYVFYIVFLFFTFVLPVQVFAQLSPQERAAMEAQLANLEAEIAQQEAILNSQRVKSSSLQREIEVLRAELTQARARIRARELEITNLASEISQKEGDIVDLSMTMDSRRKTLAELIRRTNEFDQVTFAYSLLSPQTISEFYGNIDSLAAVKSKIHGEVEVIKITKEQTEQVREQLQSKRNEEIDKKKEIEAQQRRVLENQKIQQQLLNESKNQEQAYESILADRRARAGQIRSALFELRGQRGIPFGEAYEYAKEASRSTGVRPAFILAVLKQESNLGNNVGTCNRPGDTRTWRDIMPGPNSNSWRDDHAAYLRITSKLGISPDGQPLSCPLASGGWGGAMGPSQFIPATWESYEDRVARAVGVSIANPWNPRHAIFATAIYMADLGAGAQTFTAEREAACRYYSGRGCMDPRVQNLFYGNAVMAHAERFQADIDLLESLN
jgi:membrane-bound lytic murein transglycosylase B